MGGIHYVCGLPWSEHTTQQLCPDEVPPVRRDRPTREPDDEELRWADPEDRPDPPPPTPWDDPD